MSNAPYLLGMARGGYCIGGGEAKALAVELV